MKTETIYCTCETPVMDIEHDSGCRRCGLPVDFSPRTTTQCKHLHTTVVWDESGDHDPGYRYGEETCDDCGEFVDQIVEPS